MDGVFAGSSVNSSINLTADVFANGNGDYTVSVRSVKNGKMSAATQITYTFKDGTGSKPTTVAPVTTVAPTEKATTVAPVTTQAPTEKTTTVDQPTQAPTTEVLTTKEPLTIDWSKAEFLKDGAEGGKLDNKYKGFSESDKVNFVNIQKNADNTSVIYVTFPVAVSSTTAEEAKIEGAGVGFPVDSVKEGQNLFKVTLADNSIYDVYLYEEPVKVTTVAPTEKPTTVAPTEKPTTVAPTEKATTVAPTEKTTTVAPVTTQAPTEKATTVVPTTKGTDISTNPVTIGNKETRVDNTKKETSADQKVMINKAKIKVAKRKHKSAKIKVSFKKISGVTGYQIRVSSTKKFTKKKTITKFVSKTNVKVYARKLKKAKKLYVQVRGYKIVGGKKVYGLWSGKKKVKNS